MFAFTLARCRWLGVATTCFGVLRLCLSGLAFGLVWAVCLGYAGYLCLMVTTGLWYFVCLYVSWVVWDFIGLLWFALCFDLWFSDEFEVGL